jgi:hypothetical protein
MNISDEAVEAAAKGVAVQKWPTAIGVWDSFGQNMKDDFRDQSRAALEAAAPHLTRAAPNEADEALQKILITLDAVSAGQVPQDVAFTVVREISEQWRKEHGTP